MPNNIQEILKYREEIELMKASYQDGKYANLKKGDILMERYKFIDDTSKSGFTSGYQAIAFRDISDTTTNKILFAHRGSDQIIDWVSANRKIALGKLHDKQMEDALQFVETVRDSFKIQDLSSFTHIGHSNAGLTSKVFSLIHGSTSIALDSPNLGNFIDDIEEKYGIKIPANIIEGDNNIVNIKSKGSFISEIGGKSIAGKDLSIDLRSEILGSGFDVAEYLIGTNKVHIPVKLLLSSGLKGLETYFLHSIDNLTDFIDKKFAINNDYLKEFE